MNEPIERIRRDLRNLFGPNSVQERDLNEAQAAERQAVVNEIRERLAEKQSWRYRAKYVDAILDAVATDTRIRER